MNNSDVNSKRNPFPYLLFVLASIFIISPLFQQGLFIDGLLYKTVANNYFSGEATFWKMKFNDISMNPFYEQPPLFFFITGNFYKIFGNSFIVDKLVTFIFILGSVYLLYKICQYFFKEKSGFYTVCFLLLTIPVFCWTYVNQVIETLVLPLVLFGFYSFLKFRKSDGSMKQTVYLLAFSISIILLFLTKGFQSCFIVITPFLYFIFYKEKKSLLFGILCIALISASLYFIIFIHQPSKIWFDNYLQKRLLASLNNVGATTNYRAEIILRTFTELLIPVLLVFVSLLYDRLKKKTIASNKEDTKAGWILFIIALFGSVPFSITLEQRGFYLTPSFPFFIMAIVLFFKDQFSYYFEVTVSFFANKAAYYSLLLLFFAAFTYWIIAPNLFKRDKNLISDLKLIQPFLKTNDTLAVDLDTWNDTALQAYLYMTANTNVECNYSHHYYIHDREHNTIPNSSYKKVEVPTKQYDLFIKKE